MSRTVPRILVAGFAAMTLALTACGGAEPTDQSGKIKAVASTNVWASVLSAVGGDRVEVNSIIKDPSADPHSYESTPADGLAVQRSKLMLINGGGYDDFAQQLAEQAKDARKLVAFDLSGKAAEAPPEPPDHTHQDGGGGAPGQAANEHVWYDLDSVGKVADQVATQLGEIQPSAKQTFTGNVQAFKQRLAAVKGRAEQIGAKHPGGSVLATEPVAHYLLDAARLTDVTPPEFAEAIEEESDVPVAAQDAVNQLLTGKKVAAVVHNAQTDTPVTRNVVGTAKTAGVPVVEVNETLPAGAGDYVDWIGKEVDALAGALG